MTPAMRPGWNGFRVASLSTPEGARRELEGRGGAGTRGRWNASVRRADGDGPPCAEQPGSNRTAPAVGHPARRGDRRAEGSVAGRPARSSPPQTPLRWEPLPGHELRQVPAAVGAQPVVVAAADERAEAVRLHLERPAATCANRAATGGPNVLVLAARVGLLGDVPRGRVVLLNDRVSLRGLDDRFDVALLVSRLDDEAGRVRPGALVEVARDAELLDAAERAALVDDREVARDRAEGLVQVLDALVDLPVERLVLPHPSRPLVAHSRGLL